jgi:hypothetical protein
MAGFINALGPGTLDDLLRDGSGNGWLNAANALASDVDAACFFIDGGALVHPIKIPLIIINSINCFMLPPV